MENNIVQIVDLFIAQTFQLSGMRDPVLRRAIRFERGSFMDP